MKRPRWYRNGSFGPVPPPEEADQAGGDTGPMADHIEAIRNLDPTIAQELSSTLIEFLLNHATEDLAHPDLPDELVTHLHIMIGHCEARIGERR